MENDSKKVLEFLKKAGIKAEEITLVAPRITDKVGNAYNEAENITYRYSGVGGVLVYTKEVDLGRGLLEKIVELGKEGVIVRVEEYEIEYLYTKLNEINPQMVEEATFNAREVAQKFAEDSQSVLGQIKKASQGQFSVSNRDRNTPHVKKVRVVSTIEYYFERLIFASLKTKAISTFTPFSMRHFWASLRVKPVVIRSSNRITSLLARFFVR